MHAHGLVDRYIAPPLLFASDAFMKPLEHAQTGALLVVTAATFDVLRIASSSRNTSKWLVVKTQRHAGGPRLRTHVVTGNGAAEAVGNPSTARLIEGNPRHSSSS